MFAGFMAGILWGLDTVLLGVALATAPFVSTAQAIFLAPFVSTFLHDACSSLWMFLYMGWKKQYQATLRALKSKSGKFIVLGALLGGPVGMSGYVSAIHFIGPGYTAIFSALYPAVGACLSFLFLKEKMNKVQMLGLTVCILSVIGLSYTPGGKQPENLVAGMICALVCVFGWAAEAVICAHGMKDPDLSNEQALQIRQLTSAIFYGIVFLPLLSGWDFTLELVRTPTAAMILLTALFGTASYLCYYRAISRSGATKAMAMNITYSAWALLFSFIILGVIPDVKSVLFGIAIVLGSLVAANGFPAKKTEKAAAQETP